MQRAAWRGGHYQGRGGAGGNEAVRVGTTKAGAGWALPRRAGWVLPKRGGWVLPRRSAVNDSSVTCPKALLRQLRGRLFSVSNTINIITYTDV